MSRFELLNAIEWQAERLVEIPFRGKPRRHVPLIERAVCMNRLTFDREKVRTTRYVLTGFIQSGEYVLVPVSFMLHGL